MGLALVYFSILSPDNTAFDARWYHLGIAEQYAAEGVVRRFPEGWFHGAEPQLASFLYAWAFLVPRGALFDRIELAAHLEFTIFTIALIGIPAIVRRRREAGGRAGRVPLRVGRAVPVPGRPSLRLQPVAWVPITSLRRSRPRSSCCSCARGETWRRATACSSRWRSPGRCSRSTRRALILAVPAIVAVAARAVTRALREARAAPFVAAAARGVGRAARGARGGRRPDLSALAQERPLVRRPRLSGPAPILPPSPMDGRHVGALRHRLRGDDVAGRSAASAASARPSRAVHVLVRASRLRALPRHDARVRVALLALARWPCPFLKPTRRLWGLYAIAHGGVLVWFWVHHQDRYLQAALPWMAAAHRGGAGARVAAGGRAARVGLGALVALQIVWGADVYFMPGHVFLGVPAKTSIDLLSHRSRGDD